MKSTPSLSLAVLLCFSFPGSQLDAATVGYWRMDNAANLGLDSGPNGLNLTNPNGVVATASPFPNPVPQTGQANLLSGDFERDNEQFLFVADSAAFTFQDFTIEGFVRVESYTPGTNVQTIASQLRDSGNDRAWRLALAGTGSSTFSDGQLLMQISSTGVGLTNIAETTLDFTLDLSTDYYFAAAVDFTGTNTEVTFYLQDLTNGGALQVATVSNAITSMHDSSANFAIGANYNASSEDWFDGLIDEVRLSNEVLAQESLLISVPEPAAGGLLALGALGLLARRRHRE